MYVNTHLRHISHLRGLETQIQVWAGNYFNLADKENLQLDVYVTKIAPRTEFHGPMFECHITAKLSWLHKTMFAKLVDEDFWAAYTGCAARVYHQLEKEIRRRREGVYDKAY